MKRTSIYFATAFIGFAIMSSCTKIIDIELNSALQKIVIEAKISDNHRPATLYLSRTTDFFNPSAPEKVTGALVTLSNNLDQRDTLEEISEGIYQGSTLTGQSGIKYFVKVEDGDQSYEASSSLPQKVYIDSTGFQKIEIKSPHSDPGYLVSCTYTDPGDQHNYYRINASKISRDTTNHEILRRTVILDDQLFNGQQNTTSVNRRLTFQPGDTIKIELISIDHDAFRYFNQLYDSFGMPARFSSSAPANPETNLSNGAMGYFSAQAIDQKIIILPDK
ncbi:MAG: DUF4249 domain-containing protein [Bacteroidales bacterium]|nr:DUF4249 domain-containing protein [Bacteroidales bacterium]